MKRVTCLLLLSFFINSTFLQAQTYSKTIDSLWRRVDNLMKQSLPKSALNEVEKIQELSRKENNWISYIDCILHKGELWKSYEEKPILSMIALLETEIPKTPSPTKEILYSILGQTFSEYYMMKRFYFHEQLPAVDIKPKDIETWDFSYLLNMIKETYSLSLASHDTKMLNLLQHTPIQNYENILLVENETNMYRPSLYDLLSYRALDKFMELQNNSNISVDAEIQNVYEHLDIFHSKDSLPLAWVDMMLNKNAYLRAQNKITNKEYLKQLEEWKDKYTQFVVCGDILFALANYWNEQGNNYQNLDSNSFSYRFDKKKAYTYASEAIENYPQSMGAKNSRVLMGQIKNTLFSLETKSVAIPDERILGSLQYQNMDSVFILFYRLNNAEIWAYQESMEKEEWKSSYKQAFAFQNRMYALPKTDDFQSHRVEINLGTLPSGTYLCKIASSTDYSAENTAIQIIQVSPIGCIVTTEEEEKAKGFVLNRITGKGIAGATIKLFSSNFDYKQRKNILVETARYTTESDGSFLITAKEKAKTYRLFISYKTDSIWLEESIWLRQKNEQKKEAKKIVYWFTDRSIYRPGDILEAKGILVQNLNDSISILPSQKITTTLYSTKGQEIDKAASLSNAYGSFSIRFQIPLQGLKGRMYIKAFDSRVYFDVEEYKRPSFEVNFTDKTDNYVLGDSVTVSGQALNYTGQELSDAKYTYRVYRQRTHAFFRYIKSYYPYVREKTLISTGGSICNAAGQFSLSFTASIDSSLLSQNDQNILYQFLIEVDVCDINGEIQRGVKSFLLSNTALFTNADVTENWINTKSIEIKIESTDVNGKNIPAKGTFRIYRIEENSSHWSYPRKWNEADEFIYSEAHFKNLFPWNTYENSLQKKAKESRIFVEEKTFAMGDSCVRFDNCHLWKQGRYEYELKVTDAKGNEADNTGAFNFISTLNKNEVYPSYFEFVNLTPQVQLNGNASFLLSTQQSNLWIYYEIRDNENNSKGNWIKLSKEHKTITIPLLKNSRGSQVLSILWVKNNHLYISESTIEVLRPNPNFEIHLKTFRSKIEAGGKETWELTILNIDSTFKNKEVKEVLVSMYDASLDAFVPHIWQFNMPAIPTPYSIWNKATYLPNFQNIQFYQNTYRTFVNYNPFQSRAYSLLNWEGFGNSGGRMPLMAANSRTGSMKMESAPTSDNIKGYSLGSESEERTDWEENIPLPIKTEMRKDFKETVFFYPSLLSDTNGNVRFSFVAPTGLSKWKFQCFAHSKELRTALFSTEVQTEKELMIFPKLPRFVRSGDSLLITCKTQTLSKNKVKGTILLQIFSLHSGENLGWVERDTLQTLFFDKNNNTLNTWVLRIPEGFDAIGYRFMANMGSFSDGEEGILPIYPRELKLTESMNLFVNADEQKIFSTIDFFKNKSNTSYEYSLSLEFCQNPIWYAIKALPSLRTNVNTSTGIASALFMDNLGVGILENNPDMVNTIRHWQKQELLINNLDKNTDLKQVSIENTPWESLANSENAGVYALLSMLDKNTFERNQKTLYRQLENLQMPNGAFAWIEGGVENKYITQEIIFFHSLSKSIQNNSNILDNSIFQKALEYLDVQYNSDYDKIIKHDTNKKEMYLTDATVAYLYSKVNLGNHKSLMQKNKTYLFFHTQAIQYWAKQNLYSQALLALYFYKIQEVEYAEAILRSIKERALHSEENGLYFRTSNTNESIYKAIETQALLIIAFETINKDTQTANLLKQWLIAQKRTQNWGSERATSLAIYALFSSENTKVSSLEKTNEINIQMGDITINTSELKEKDVEAGSGYFRKTWTGKDIPTQFEKITLEKKGGRGISFGALYRQYSEDANKIKASKGNLEIRKTYYVSISTLNGKEKWEVISPNHTLKIGDRVQVQLEILSDRNLNFVHLVNMRAAALEPLAFTSGYMYENGLSYYKSIEDASIHYFFERIAKGQYSISYEVKVDQAGVFSDGTASIQCLYAPEFVGHSQGGVFSVSAKNK